MIKLDLKISQELMKRNEIIKETMQKLHSEVQNQISESLRPVVQLARNQGSLKLDLNIMNRLLTIPNIEYRIPDIDFNYSGWDEVSNQTKRRPAQKNIVNSRKIGFKVPYKDNR